ncbi:DUF3889 domain-containing protein [Bacillus sp. CGMCC 1.16541]|uniref:DUF3889 domain-containing protein n=1 Tax=Bacillus sp. CGMCC 1.16541 TaxID=2185143 RepID=UPI001EF60647|nr:DUF3889 domain-containing protein [Bacillus sp. CGMCC 1.16541]
MLKVVVVTLMLLPAAPHILYTEAKAASYNAATFPAHAKWGKIAMQQVKNKYPYAKIVDYLHVGREINEPTSIETFKLQVKNGEKMFNVTVKIEFDTKTENVLNMKLIQTN